MKYFLLKNELKSEYTTYSFVPGLFSVQARKH